MGCGQGPDLLAMSKLGAGELFGLDMAPNAVKLARRVLEGKNAYLVVADALALPFRSNYFDVVNVSHMLERADRGWILVLLVGPGDRALEVIGAEPPPRKECW